ncbi:MAG: serine hydrolase family protein [Candidatus Chisholmbacteria bacterium]|nr:serine hydrolase family protein [Candidatus Chisholmbacteria bacterium]
MKRVVILHGWTGHSQKNWFPWLKAKLEKNGYVAYVPDLPNSYFPKLKPWLRTLRETIGIPDKNLILIGHSLGAVTVLRYLETLPQDKKIKAAILVAGFLSSDVKIDSKELVAFLTPPWSWPKIRRSSNQFFVINSDNDPYIPVSEARLLAQNLHQKLILQKNQGHFNVKYNPKYKRFPFLLKLFAQIENKHQ